MFEQKKGREERGSQENRTTNREKQAWVIIASICKAADKMLSCSFQKSL